MSDMHSGDIESWATSSAFDELTPEQQRIVVGELGSPEAYQTMRVTLNSTRAELRRTQRVARPDHAIIDNLHATMRGKHAVARETLLSRLMSLRVPVYQAALGAAAVAFLLLMLRPAQQISPPIVTREIVEVPARDTIVLSADSQGEKRESVAERDALLAGDGPGASGVIRGGRAAFQSAAHSTKSSRDSRDHATASHERREPADRDAMHSGRRLGSLTSTPADMIDVGRRNHFVGLDNVPLLAHQRRGVTLSEDTAYRRFTFAVN